jgi:hypothetical protein
LTTKGTSETKANDIDINGVKVNSATAIIVKAYLEYAGDLVKESLAKDTYSSKFKELNDELVITPKELIDLVYKVQIALISPGDVNSFL